MNQKHFPIKVALVVNPEMDLVSPQELFNKGLEIVKNVLLEQEIRK